MTTDGKQQQLSFSQTSYQIGVLALLYFIGGKVGLFFATPPGYTTAIWPPAGIALAVLLIYGLRLWPGILIGSIMINMSLVIDIEKTSELMPALLLALSIGAGAVVQALVGSYFIKRYVNIYSGLIMPGSVILFFALGGPLSCLISATWGVTSLYIADQLSTSNLLYNWVTWWVGDTIGVFLLVPLIFIWFGQPRELWEQRRFHITFPLIFTALMVMALFFISSQQEQEKIEREFSEQSRMVADSLDKIVLRTIEVIYSTQSLFNLLEETPVDRRQFRQYVERSLSRNAGLQALSWNRVVKHADREHFESEIRAEGFPDFSIRERNASGELVPALPNEKYVAVTFIEPLKANEKALGYDVYSNPARRNALDLATSTGKLIATDPIKLVQESGEQAGLLFFLPVYKNGQTPQREYEREEQLVGYIVGVFRTGDLLQEAIGDHDFENVDVQLIDVNDPARQVQLANYSIDRDGRGHIRTREKSTFNTDTLHWGKTLHYGQRPWLLQVYANDEYLTDKRSWPTWGVLAGGFLFTAFLGSFLLIITGRVIADKIWIDEIQDRKSTLKDLRAANKKLTELAKIDPLTLTHNHRSILEIGKRLNSEYKRYTTQYAVLALELSDYQEIAKQWDGKTAELVLKEVSSRINRQLRDTDDVGRWSENVFLVLVRHTPQDQLVELSKRICETIRSHDIEPVGSVTISAGIAYSLYGEIFEDVVQRATNSLAISRRKGGKRVEMFR